MKGGAHTYIGVLALFIILFPGFAHALLPPDLIFSAGMQIVQFFTIFAVAIGGLFSSGLFFFRTYLRLSWTQFWVAVALVLFVVLVAATAVFVRESTKTYELHAEQVAYLEEAVENISLSCQEQVREACSLPPLEQGSSTELYPPYKTFVSDSVMLFAPDAPTPLVLQMDVNRRQDAPSLFTQYSFLDGVVGEQAFNDYTSVRTASYEVLPNGFIQSFARTLPPDLSTRDTYTGTVLVDGDELQYVSSDIVGDFVTRSHPSYTRHQSVGEAEVTYRGETFTAYALVEDMFADDYREYIFFDGYYDVVATTHQFILWDEEGSFYMIDQSEVSSDSPQYPSHTWVLYKDARSGAAHKTFTADVTKGEVESWSVVLPIEGESTIELEGGLVFKDKNDRMRLLVEGVVQDQKGSRGIKGVLLIVK